MLCQFCNKILKNNGTLAIHEKSCKLNPNRIKRKVSPNAGAKKGYTPWNKGLRGDPRSKHSESTRKKLSEVSKGTAHSPEKELERRLKISQKAKLNNGGYRMGSGRGKKGWYKGFFCDSSWELAYVIYCLDHNIKIQRNTEKREYIWNDKYRTYIPDFVVENQLVEIKGYLSPQWEAKLRYNPDVTVLYEKDLKHVFDYVIQNYGKDYIKLYEQMEEQADWRRQPV